MNNALAIRSPWRARRANAVVFGSAAVIVLVASAAWACFPPHQFILTPSSGPAGQTITVEAFHHTTTNGTYNLNINPTAGNTVAGNCKTFLGTISYSNGAGAATATIPSGLAPGYYMVCSMIDPTDQKAYYQVK